MPAEELIRESAAQYAQRSRAAEPGANPLTVMSRRVRFGWQAILLLRAAALSRTAFHLALQANCGMFHDMRTELGTNPS